MNSGSLRVFGTSTVLEEYLKTRRFRHEMKGKKVTIIETKNLNIGNHQYLINTPELSSGIYFIRFDIGRNVYSKKILLVK